MMNDELKPCPFCKSKVKRIKVKKTWDGKIPPDIHHPKHKRCYLATENFYTDEWQIRPIEDALRAERDQFKSMVERLIEVGEYLIADACDVVDREVWQTLVAKAKEQNNG